MANLPSIPTNLSNLVKLREFLDELRTAISAAIDDAGGGGGDVKADGSTPFTAMQLGVAAEHSDGLVTLAQVAGSIMGSIKSVGTDAIGMNETKTIFTDSPASGQGFLFALESPDATPGTAIIAGKDQTAGAGNGIYYWWEFAGGAVEFKVKQKGGNTCSINWTIIQVAGTAVGQ